ncbi:glycosyl transferase [Mycobacterium sp. 1423905.2]|nr:glycosyl transferase [Mycobacterium sp. 1423905.2]
MSIWAVAAAVLLVATVPLRTPRAGLLGGGDDFDAYRDGVQHVLAHSPLYAEPLIHQHLYTYPPFSIVVFLPFSWLPFGTDTNIWLAFNVVVLIAAVLLCWRILGYRFTPYLLAQSLLLSAVCTFLEPVRSTLLHGQINLVLLALVLWDGARGAASRLKGVGVGLAAGVKLTPAYFILYYLAVRQWRATAVALAAVVATIVVGWAALPSDSRQYWSGTFADSKRIGDDPLHPSNQSLGGAIARLTAPHPDSPIGHLPGNALPMWAWLLPALAVTGASMWVVVRLHRAGERLLAVTITGLTAAVVSPFSWTHHWVWFVPLLVYLVHRAQGNARWWLPAAGLFLLIGAWPYRFPMDLEPRIGLFMFPDTWAPWEVLANLYILLYAVILAAAATWVISRDRVRRKTVTDAAEPAPQQ